MLFYHYFRNVPVSSEVYDQKHTPNDALKSFVSQPLIFITYSTVLLATPQPYCHEASIIVNRTLHNNYDFYHFCFDARNPDDIYDDTPSIAENLEALKELIKTDIEYFQKMR